MWYSQKSHSKKCIIFRCRIDKVFLLFLGIPIHACESFDHSETSTMNSAWWCTFIRKKTFSPCFCIKQFFSRSRSLKPCQMSGILLTIIVHRFRIHWTNAIHSNIQLFSPGVFKSSQRHQPSLPQNNYIMFWKVSYPL